MVASTDSGGNLVITNASGNNVTVADAAGNSASTTAGLGLTSGASSTNGVVGTPLTVDQIITAVNGNTSLNTQIKASKDSNGYLSLQNLTASSDHS